MALPAVMALLAVAMLLGAAAMRSAQRQSRVARQARERVSAFYAAEAALRDAEGDIRQGTRAHQFGHSDLAASPFTPGVCHRLGDRRGLCQGAPGAGAIWLTAGLDNDLPLSAGVPYGTFTGRAWLDAASAPPPPRYVIEALPDLAATDNATIRRPMLRYLYRITAVGFGARGATPVYLQAVYRKPAMTGGNDAAPRQPAGRLNWREITAWQEMRAEAAKDARGAGGLP